MDSDYSYGFTFQRGCKPALLVKIEDGQARMEWASWTRQSASGSNGRYA